MSIQIDMLRIAGFRGILNLEISLPRVTLLIGQNNSGKTSVIKALQLALGDYARFLSDEDFHIDDNEKRKDKILVDLRFVAIDETGKRKSEFSEDWIREFGDKIRQEVNGKQFIALRATAFSDKIKGGYIVERYYLNAWPEFANWQTESVNLKNKQNKKYESIPFISIDAQRDIHSELKEKSSFICRVLSSVEYDDEDIVRLEKMVAEINKEAIDKSEPLKKLKEHLDKLNQSFDGSGQTELTPFPKKIRDLSKRFSVHFGESEKNSFSMEYHGMGTRSWASILTVKALTELMAKKHEEEAEPFFPIIAAEEPEAHLHPNAQRTLYSQLIDMPGQVIISTHSPYLAGMADLYNLRGLIRLGSSIKAVELIKGLDAEDINTLQREIMRLRGEMLFAKAIILFEGVTEEQLIPAMFQKYFKCSPFSAGINCISVAGKNYPPFIKMAISFGIPVCIISDNDGNTKQEVESQVEKVKKIMPTLMEEIFHVEFLTVGNDIEAELMALGLKQEIIDALVLTDTRGSNNDQHLKAKKKEIEKLSDLELIKKMRSSKASYAGFLSDVISRNPYQRTTELMLPEAVRSAFSKIKEWSL